MKNILLILFFTAAILTVKAQDKIITTKKDTIECHIIAANADRISYEQKSPENQMIGKSIATSDVLQYIKAAQPEKTKNLQQKPEHRLLIIVQGGLSHSLTDMDAFKNLLTNAGVPASEADDYTGKLKNGFHFNTGFHYLIANFFGVGAEYSFSQSSSDGKFIVSGYSGMNLPVYSTTTLNEKIYSNFIGPSVLFQQTPGAKQKIRISETITPGIVFFRDETRGNEYQVYLPTDDVYYGQLPQYYGDSNTMTQGKTFGAKGSLTVEYLITSQLSVGVAGSFIWANLHKVSIKSLNYNSEIQELENPMDISRIDYGISVHYNF